ncbi:FAD-binding protein [Calidifontibacter sp. DB0510]|uniref:FAD-binding protein n=1 Tax=Metallococcus carri TaxID=1656884 RepID=A0A967AZG3_9MICO|nr:D-arabinono-1,4-lactone oxidase [Metallococcus carri]NHN55252.1 FAD-binding protein [Metallococcus carri]NOP36329.1 FAD-binding protein [Calidifontibacter sp. DB2511S]
MAEWSNWSGTVVAQPDRIIAVRDVAHVQEICATATRDGLRVKPIGSGHSFTGIGEPVDIQLRMDALAGIRSVDEEAGRVWLGAGTRLADAVVDLHARGLALANQGDYDRQTLSGATSTGTHGTGIGLTGFAGMVRGVELVLADGSLLRITDTSHADWLPGAALTLGALGVLTAIEFQCVPSYLLTSVEKPMELAEVLGGLDDLVDSHDHFEFFWFPASRRVLAKLNERHTDLARRDPLPGWKARLDDDLIANRLFGVVNELTTRVPRLSAPLNRVSTMALSGRSYTDWSHIVYPTDRDVRFRESEFSVPRAAVAPVLRELDGWLRRHSSITSFPLEVRFTAADDRWLSTAYGRASGYIAVHQFHKRPHQDYFEAFWWILRAHCGDEARPHWGKMHDLDAARLRAAYPKFDDFVALRDRLDPARTFANPYLDRVLGA